MYWLFILYMYSSAKEINVAMWVIESNYFLVIYNEILITLEMIIYNLNIALPRGLATRGRWAAIFPTHLAPSGKYVQITYRKCI